MKKLITYILLTITISLTLGSAATFAYTNDQILIAADTVEEPYNPSIIPKPEFLPGPSEETQETFCLEQVRSGKEAGGVILY